MLRIQNNQQLLQLECKTLILTHTCATYNIYTIYNTTITTTTITVVVEAVEVFNITTTTTTTTTTSQCMRNKSHIRQQHNSSTTTYTHYDTYYI